MFPSKYLTEEDIRERLRAIQREREELLRELGRPEVSTDPERMAPLAQRLGQLERVLPAIEQFRTVETDYATAQMLLEEEPGSPVASALASEEQGSLEAAAAHLYAALLQEGYLDEEKEDAVDRRILEYLRSMGAEYPWRLGINLKIREEEAIERLKRLETKDLVERVQGTMLDNYHRQKDWTKHMNHTYYRLSRAGDQYLRQLRRGLQ